MQESSSRNVLHHSNTSTSIYSTTSNNNNNRSVTLPFGLHFPERRASISRFSNVNQHNNLVDGNQEYDSIIDIKNKSRKVDYKEKDGNRFDVEKHKENMHPC